MTESFIKVYVVDAFTNELYSGNPAAVCCLEKVSVFSYAITFRFTNSYD